MILDEIIKKTKDDLEKEKQTSLRSGLVARSRIIHTCQEMF